MKRWILAIIIVVVLSAVNGWMTIQDMNADWSFANAR